MCFGEALERTTAGIVSEIGIQSITSKVRIIIIMYSTINKIDFEAEFMGPKSRKRKEKYI